MSGVHPSVSVITVVKNDREGLRITAASVAAQRGDVRHVVIDGASTDGTYELIERLRPTLAHASSAADSGIAQAFNRGLQAARGEWINFLNAGDTFISEDVVERALSLRDDHLIVTGFAVMGQEHPMVLPAKPTRRRHHLARRALLAHQASFVHRSVFERVGPFDERFRMRMDYEFFLRALRVYDARFIPETWVKFDAGHSASNHRIFTAEERLANKLHLRDALLVNAGADARRAAEHLLYRTRYGHFVQRMRGQQPRKR